MMPSYSLLYWTLAMFFGSFVLLVALRIIVPMIFGVDLRWGPAAVLGIIAAALVWRGSQYKDVPGPSSYLRRDELGKGLGMLLAILVAAVAAAFGPK